MWARWVIAALFLTVGSVGDGWAEDAIGTRPLLTIARKDLHTILPPDCHILINPHSIEQFLDALDRSPPDWGLVYGHGHHDPALVERLFTLNRGAMRSAAGRSRSSGRWCFCGRRNSRATIQRRVGSAWPLGRFSPRRSGGVVRFKPEEVPSNLVVIPEPSTRDVLRRQLEAGQKVDIEIAMVGRLIPEESLVYDFSHDEEGLGLIMPVVRIERVEYLLVR